jgi:transcription elongation factor GreA
MLEPEQITPEGLEALRAEIAQLESEGRTEMAARIKAARELGDLKENAEYHIAKDDQAHLETKIKRLTERLRAARVVEGTRDPDVVGFGSTVGVVDEASGRALEFTLVGPTEADLKTGRLSSESPVARALIGARAGDDVSVATPGGERRYRVNSVS